MRKPIKIEEFNKIKNEKGNEQTFESPNKQKDDSLTYYEKIHRKRE